jgi:hypothetical protein
MPRMQHVIHNKLSKKENNFQSVSIMLSARGLEILLILYKYAKRTIIASSSHY